MTKLIDTEMSLLIDVALIRSRRPLTLEEIARDSGIVITDLQPMLQGRSTGRKATLVKLMCEGVYTYDLTPTRYAVAKTVLQSFAVSPAEWARAERKFKPPGKSRR